MEAPFLQTLLHGSNNFPKVCFEFGLCFKKLKPLHPANYQWHRKAFSIYLGAYTVPQILQNSFITCYKSADTCHGLCKCGEIQVDLILYALLLANSGARFTHGSKTMRIVYK